MTGVEGAVLSTLQQLAAKVSSKRTHRAILPFGSTWTAPAGVTEVGGVLIGDGGPGDGSYRGGGSGGVTPLDGMQVTPGTTYSFTRSSMALHGVVGQWNSTPKSSANIGTSATNTIVEIGDAIIGAGNNGAGAVNVSTDRGNTWTPTTLHAVYQAYSQYTAGNFLQADPVKPFVYGANITSAAFNFAGVGANGVLIDSGFAGAATPRGAGILAAMNGVAILSPGNTANSIAWNIAANTRSVLPLVVGNQTMPNAGWALMAADGFVLGGAGNSNALTVATNFGFTVKANVSVAVAVNVPGVGSAITTGGKAFVMALDGSVYYTSDYGSTFTNAGIVSGTPQINTFAYMAPSGFAALKVSGNLYVSNNFGHTWTAVYATASNTQSALTNNGFFYFFDNSAGTNEVRYVNIAAAMNSNIASAIVATGLNIGAALANTTPSQIALFGNSNTNAAFLCRYAESNNGPVSVWSTVNGGALVYSGALNNDSQYSLILNGGLTAAGGLVFAMSAANGPLAVGLGGQGNTVSTWDDRAVTFMNAIADTGGAPRTQAYAAPGGTNGGAGGVATTTNGTTPLLPTPPQPSLFGGVTRGGGEAVVGARPIGEGGGYFAYMPPMPGGAMLEWEA